MTCDVLVSRLHEVQLLVQVGARSARFSADAQPAYARTGWCREVLLQRVRVDFARCGRICCLALTLFDVDLVTSPDFAVSARPRY